MRILDQDDDKSINTVTLYLESNEAKELRDCLDQLLKKPLNNHIHVSDEKFEHELTVCMYDTSNLNGFNDRSKKLIIEDV